MTETVEQQKAPRARAGGIAWLFVLTAILIAALDLGSKAWAWGFVEAHGDGEYFKVYSVVAPWFKLVKAENPGTVWGLFQNATPILVGVRCVMVVVICVLAWRTPKTDRGKLIGFGLVLGGALGNLYDNLFRESGAVRDFLDFHIPLPWRENLYHYPTFNVADSAILTGAVLLFLAFGREGKTERSRAAESAES